MRGTIDSAVPGTFESDTGGTFNPLLSFDLYLERRAGNGNAILPAKAAPKRYVYGLDGIRELFHCSHKQAQFYKDNVIREAVKQNGRKIVVDADYALELFNQRRAK